MRIQRHRRHFWLEIVFVPPMRIMGRDVLRKPLQIAIHSSGSLKRLCRRAKHAVTTCVKLLLRVLSTLVVRTNWCNDGLVFTTSQRARCRPGLGTVALQSVVDLHPDHLHYRRAEIEDIPQSEAGPLR